MEIQMRYSKCSLAAVEDIFMEDKGAVEEAVVPDSLTDSEKARD